ncbi:HET-domain-containing protein [Pyrenochaeta sp. DS3sAY3a]|nr:HET-domain-containing protein [Pyrenochaeta sp. DS3sAY3a]
MRLLQCQGDNTFKLVYRVDKQIPPYAILSHTWGADEDEVTFRDLIEGTGTTKVGYRKINFCAKQAAVDGLQYFWIDTCCIDKKSSAELLEAINCMFRWYKDSAKCYVYLDDVLAENLVEDGLAFQKSRWFTRGWTLQELLAPKIVEFFSREGFLLGSKTSRVQEIAEVTGIPIEALQGKPLSEFSVDQRMIWAKGRETTREEDLAYSLLGVFDIQMSLYYGEGRQRAFKRLNKKISNARDAGRSHAEEDVPLRSDHFSFELQTATMLQEPNDNFSLLMAGSRNKDGPPDLIAVKRGTTSDENLEVNIIYGSHTYQNLILRIATPNFTPLRENWTEQLAFALADWTGDGMLDLVVIKKFSTGTNSTEVHIFSGASKFQHLLLQTGTCLQETDDSWTFGMGTWGAGNTRPDLFAIKKSGTETETTEVHVLSGDSNFQHYKLQVPTCMPETSSQFDFVVTDWNRGAQSDLVAVKKSKTSGRCTEVYVLSGAATYKEFSLRAETPMFRTNGWFEFAVADWTGNGRPDLVALRKRSMGTNAAEIHVMSQQGS